MYDGLYRWRGQKQATEARVRQVSADAHYGTYRDHLRRHEVESADAARGTKKQREKFSTCLFRRASNERNLRCAIDYLDAHGGPAPGPDGQRLADLDDRGRWELARAVRDQIRSGRYRPGPHRSVRIPKGPGRGDRNLQIQDVRDRVVQRAIVQIVQPLLDPSFSDNSYGYRPKRGREQALAHAAALAERDDLWVWVAEDVRDAFDQVPLNRLLDVLATRIPARDFLRLVWAVISGKGHRGLRQGGSLSPLLLNLYLDHVLDRPWAKAHPKWPLIRVADDLLILTPNRAEAREAREALERLLRPAGMPLKGTTETTVHDLSAGERVRWLGYELTRGDEDLQAHLPDDSPAWSKLADGLRLAHETSCAPLRAREMIVGWIAALGPSYDHVDRGAAHARITRMARELAYEEVPDGQEVEVLWADAHARWGRNRSAVRARMGGCRGGRTGRECVRRLRHASATIDLQVIDDEPTGSRPPGPAHSRPNRRPHMGRRFQPTKDLSDSVRRMKPPTSILGGWASTSWPLRKMTFLRRWPPSPRSTLRRSRPRSPTSRNSTLRDVGNRAQRSPAMHRPRTARSGRAGGKRQRRGDRRVGRGLRPR